MNRFLIRLFFVAALLCDFLGFTDEVRARDVAPKSEEQIRQSDGCLNPVAEEPQSPVEIVFRSAPSSPRVASNRPTRLLPTYGGKPNKHHGQWAADEVYKPFKAYSLQSCRSPERRHAVASPSRLYYVIALRRLLC